MQLALFSDTERDQLERNRRSLEVRVASHPQPRLPRKKRPIYARFRDPQPRLFPVAVTYLVPAKLAQAGGRGIVR